MGQIIGLFFTRREENDCAARGAAIIVTTAAASIYKEDWPAGYAKGTAFASALPAEMAICQIGVQELADRTAAQGISQTAKALSPVQFHGIDFDGVELAFASWRKSKRL
jgi:hypothetical protein